MSCTRGSGLTPENGHFRTFPALHSPETISIDHSCPPDCAILSHFGEKGFVQNGGQQGIQLRGGLGLQALQRVELDTIRRCSDINVSELIIHTLPGTPHSATASPDETDAVESANALATQHAVALELALVVNPASEGFVPRPVSRDFAMPEALFVGEQLGELEFPGRVARFPRETQLIQSPTVRFRQTPGSPVLALALRPAEQTVPLGVG